MIVGLVGKKESGKCSVALELVDRHGFRLMSFAKPLKSMLHVFLSNYGLTAEQLVFAQENKEVEIQGLGVSYRVLAQTLGAEWGRALYPDVWAKIGRRWAIHYGGDIVFDDVRFENESDVIRDLGGRIVHIVRPGLLPTDVHISERGVLVRPGDVVITYGGALPELIVKVFAALGVGV